MTSGEPVIINCILDDERFQGAAIAALGAVAISQLHTPLIDKSGTVVGVLSLMNKVSFKTGPNPKPNPNPNPNPTLTLTQTQP